MIKNDQGNSPRLKTSEGLGCGRTSPRRSLRTRIFDLSSHQALSDDREAISNAWLRKCSSDKENTGLFKTTRTGSKRQPAHIFAPRERRAPCTAHAQKRKRGNSPLTDREATPGEVNHRPTQANANGPHLHFRFDERTIRLD